MKLSIIIPVYNEERTVETLLNKVVNAKYEGVEKEIIIVEGNSTDRTREIVTRFAKEHGIRLILEDGPHGKGAASRLAFKETTGDTVLIQDGDLEYDPDEYMKFLTPIINGEAKVVNGSRSLGAGLMYRKYSGIERLHSFVLNIGSFVFVTLLNLLYGVRITDVTSMLKFYPGDFIRSVNLREDGFGIESELTAKLAKQGYKILEVPASFKGRSHAEGKKLNFFKDGFVILKAIIKYRFTD